MQTGSLETTTEVVLALMVEYARMLGSDPDPAQLEPTANLFSDLGLDSLSVVDMVVDLDQRFGVEIPLHEWVSRINAGEAQVDDYFTVGAFCAHVESCVGRADGVGHGE